MIVEISFFHIVPFIVCLILIIGPITGAIISKNLIAATPLLIILPLATLFINFLTAKVIITLNHLDNSLKIKQASLIAPANHRYQLSDLADIHLVSNKPVRQGPTRSIEFIFKNGPPLKTLGSNLSRNEVELTEIEIARMRSFFSRNP